MKKNIRIVLSAVLLVAMLAVLSACGGGDGNKAGSDAAAADPAKAIVGNWVYGSNSSYEYEFKEDGTGSYYGRTFTYTIDGEKISILYDGDSVPFESTFSIDGNKLDIKDSRGNSTIYTKK